MAISVITETELRTGAAKSESPTRTLRLIENFLRPLTVLEFASEDAIDLTLVSNNEREFRRISGLRLENWTS